MFASATDKIADEPDRGSAHAESDSGHEAELVEESGDVHGAVLSDWGGGVTASAGPTERRS